ncbi:phenolic acid decarboxylase [Pseudomonas koreensis]|uniref:phenolic acid decarboxylase n=1 Tax=Pseudomonas koreensis TaxID=198620 RepID=UPI003C6DDCE6
MLSESFYRGYAQVSWRGAYHYVVIPEFAKVTYLKNGGPDIDAVIDMPPDQMLRDYIDGK